MSMRDTSAALSFVPHLPQHLEYDEVLFAFYFSTHHSSSDTKGKYFCIIQKGRKKIKNKADFDFLSKE